MDVENLLVKASDNLSVRRAFGTAYEKDGTLIIPVAIVAGGGGGGTARGERLELFLVGCGSGQHDVRPPDLGLGVRQVQLCGALAQEPGGSSQYARRGGLERPRGDAGRASGPRAEPS